MSCDFHVHSSVSDGTLTPVEVVDLARREGIGVIALTDHDDVSGVRDATARGHRVGVEVLPGVEISVSEQDGRVQMHILGLGIDVRNERLLEGLAQQRARRRARAARIARRLDALGLGLDLERLDADLSSRAIGRLHIARSLVDAGSCSNVEEAFARYLRRGRPAYEPTVGMSARNAIELLHAAGGIACLAHPRLSAGADAPGGLEAFVERLTRLGLDGLEVQHPAHRPAEMRRLRRLARRHGLIATGGSDFHGDGKPGLSLGRGRGTIAVHRSTYREILAGIEQHRPGP